MKIAKKLVMIFSVIAMLFATIGCGSGGKPAKIDDLDAAIRDTSNYLNSSIPSGSKIVILNIQSNSAALSDYIIDELIANAVNDKIFSVVDRHQLDAIRAEQNFQSSGEVADNQALEIGKFFGAQTIVSGTISQLGAGYRIRVRALEVQTALVQGQFNRNIASSPLVGTITGSGGGGSATTAQTGGRQAATGTASQSQSSSGTPRIIITNNTGKNLVHIAYFPTGTTASSDIKHFDIGGGVRNNESKTITLSRIDLSKVYFIGSTDSEGNRYLKRNITFTSGMTIVLLPEEMFEEAPKALKIGDTGPAGGIIFYDKGNNNGGWRYLEAAPAEAEFQAIFSIHGSSHQSRASAAPYGTTEESIGSGKRNTQSLVEKSKQITGEWDTAAQKVVELNINGFNDWFLPSITELDQMYGNLRRRNLDEFRNGFYWSSTDVGYQNDAVQGVRVINFENGSHRLASSRRNQYFVRPVRQVPGPAR
ncbi:MAG: DUF1566 domain-containing protein [Treponema sp.]|nr:DUF1566 domain-containing protein [Treponema sp.]